MSRIVCLLVLALLPRLAAARTDAPPDLDTLAAKHHYELGAAHYERGDFAAALGEFEIARRIKPLPALDYNIARCLDRMERWQEAIAAYKRFVLTTPSLKESEEARERVRALRQKLEPPAAAPAPAATIAVAPSPSPAPSPRAPIYRSSLFVPVVVGASGLLITTIGLGLSLSVGPDYDRLAATCAPNCPTASWQGLETRERAGAALLSIGGLALAADVALWVVRAVKGRRAPTRAWLAPSGTGLVVAGVF